MSRMHVIQCEEGVECLLDFKYYIWETLLAPEDDGLLDFVSEWAERGECLLLYTPTEILKKSYFILRFNFNLLLVVACTVRCTGVKTVTDFRSRKIRFPGTCFVDREHILERRLDPWSFLAEVTWHTEDSAGIAREIYPEQYESNVYSWSVTLLPTTALSSNHSLHHQSHLHLFPYFNLRHIDTNIYIYLPWSISI